MATWGTVNHNPSVEEKIMDTVALGFRRSSQLPWDNALTFFP